jgi:hypothetical protein
MSAKQPSPGATRRAKAFLSRYTYLVLEDLPDALGALARAFDREYRRGFSDAGEPDARARRIAKACTDAYAAHVENLKPNGLAYQRQRWDSDAATRAEMLQALNETAPTEAARHPSHLRYTSSHVVCVECGVTCTAPMLGSFYAARTMMHWPTCSHAGHAETVYEASANNCERCGKLIGLDSRLCFGCGASNAP